MHPHQIGIELPMDSLDAAQENNKPDGTTLLNIIGPGFVTNYSKLVIPQQNAYNFRSV